MKKQNFGLFWRLFFFFFFGMVAVSADVVRRRKISSPS